MRRASHRPSSAFMTACDKLGYRTESDARRALSHMSRKFNGIIPYLCQPCGYWHLGHPYKDDNGLKRKLP